MTVKELIEYLREGVREGSFDMDTIVVIYDCHDAEMDCIELEPEHIIYTEDLDEDVPLLLISNQED